MHEDPVLAAADGYSYLHLLIVAGIIVFAVGVKEAVARRPAHLAARRGWRCAAASRCMLGGVAFRLRMVGAVGWAKLAAAARAWCGSPSLGGAWPPGWTRA